MQSNAQFVLCEHSEWEFSRANGQSMKAFCPFYLISTRPVEVKRSDAWG